MELLSSSSDEDEPDQQHEQHEVDATDVNQLSSSSPSKKWEEEEDLLHALFNAPSPTSRLTPQHQQSPSEAQLPAVGEHSMAFIGTCKDVTQLAQAQIHRRDKADGDAQQSAPPPSSPTTSPSSSSRSFDGQHRFQRPLQADSSGKQIVSARDLLMKLCPKVTQQILPTKASYEFHYRTPPKKTKPRATTAASTSDLSCLVSQMNQQQTRQSSQTPRSDQTWTPPTPREAMSPRTPTSRGRPSRSTKMTPHSTGGSPSSRPRNAKDFSTAHETTPPRRFQQQDSRVLGSKHVSYISPFLSGNSTSRKRKLDEASTLQEDGTVEHRNAVEMDAEEDDLWFSDSAMNKTLSAVERKDLNDDDELRHQRRRRSLTPVQKSSSIEPRKFSGATSIEEDEDSLNDEDEEDRFDGGDERWPRLPAPDDDTADASVSTSLRLSPSIQVCAPINRFLFDYQREGIQFLFDAYARNTGAILGDEMGLGKTIQVVALLSALLHKRGDARDKTRWREIRAWRRETHFDLTKVSEQTKCEQEDNEEEKMSVRNRVILIVVPASLLQNWQLELQVWMFCTVVLLMGPRLQREEILERIRGGEYEIVLCSYDMLKIHEQQLRSMKWHVMVLDEMHCLKNPEAKSTKAVLALKKCKRKIGLTGTLMQNNEEELHCLLNAIAPGCAGTLSEFRAFYADDIKYGRKKSAAPEAILRSREKEAKLRDLLSGIYLRRDKQIHPTFEQIAKKDVVVFCELTELQKRVYESILNLPEYQALRRPTRSRRRTSRRRQRRRKRHNEFDEWEEEDDDDDEEEAEGAPEEELDVEALQRDGVLWKRFHSSEEPCRRCPNCIALVCVAQLLKLANHVDLLKVNPSEPDDEVREFTAQFASKVFGDHLEQLGGVEQSNRFVDMKDTRLCGKMQVLAKLLTFWQAKRQKALIFSRSTRMLDILQMFVIGKGIAYVRLDGHTKISERLELVQRFNRDATLRVFLISTKAGGLGLNMTSARHVVLFDPSWNPAHDCQAQDRAYRLGQTQDVHVYRLITLGTIEEMIYVRQIYKQQLADTTLKGLEPPRYFEAIQGVPGQQGELFGIRNLLQLKEGGVLKGIQDAYYKRDAASDLVMRETEVDYNQLAAKERGQAASSVLGVSSTAGARARPTAKPGRKGATKSKSKEKRSSSGTEDGNGKKTVKTIDGDAEMVEVADEMLQLMEEDDQEPSQEQDHEESELCRQAARQMLCHEDIVHEANRRNSVATAKQSQYPPLALTPSPSSRKRFRRHRPEQPLRDKHSVEQEEDDDEQDERDQLHHGEQTAAHQQPPPQPCKIYIPKYL